MITVLLAVALIVVGISATVFPVDFVDAARGMTTIALTGRDGGEAGRRADIHLHVPHENTARVQEVHGLLLHVICELVEREL